MAHWGAIIQAIDNAMNRTQKSMSAGLDVSRAQAGGSSGYSNSSNSSLGSDIASIIQASKQKDEDKSVVSDERMKELFSTTPDIVEAFSKINAYKFNYKPEALKLYSKENGVDDGTNIGVMAQELEKNPITENVVTEDENGYKQIEVGKLAAADAAVLSDVCKRLLALEEKVNGRE